ncbi:MAG: type I-E CRISPR-associated protein Cas6/Cse3/CasE [Candidatus Helarchaeota archaeon]
MYLTRAYLNPSNHQVLVDLIDVYQMHRTLCSAFPDSGNHQSAREKYKILYRLEYSIKSNQIVLYIQSAIKPDIMKIESKFANYFEKPPESRNINHFIQKIKHESHYRFKLKANPTKKMKKKDSGKSTRVPLKFEKEQIEWLVRKGKMSGFKLALVKIVKDSHIYDLAIVSEIESYAKPIFNRNYKKNLNLTHKMTFYSVIYEGHLIITDPDLFKDTIKKGIGPGKAFGFGLMSIAPL